MKYFKILVSAFVLLLVLSCDKDIEKFTNNENFIYFNMPFVLDQYNRPTTERVKQIEYSFSLEDSDYKTHTIKIPVNTISLPSDQERSYKVEIIAEETTATNEDWDPSSVEKTVIKAGKIVDTLCIVVKRNKNIELEAKTIAFRLVASDHFKLGVPELLTAKVSFSDILLAPDYWVKIKKYVGTVYYKEVYRKWIEIYYLGADPNTESISYAPNYGKPLWHGNMPHLASSISSYYPSTEMFLGRLKKYFDENDVYPDGDTTKDPIRLPRV